MAEYLEKIRTILLASDLSNASFGALNYAKQFAKSLSAKLLVVHVVDPCGVPLQKEREKETIADLINSAEDHLQKVNAALCYESVRNVVMVRQGAIEDVLLELIGERNIDLLVIGTSGKGNKSSEKLGSVAERLLRTMPCPVLTVGTRVRQDALEETHLRGVLLPTDFSETSQAAVAYAERLTHYLAGHLLLLHVNEDGVDAASPQCPGGRFQEVASQIQDPSIVSEYITRRGTPVDTIVAVAHEKRVDFIVLGVHERNKGEGPALPRVAYDVIRLATCPVLTVCPTCKGL
ncbi:universal stress protein [Acidipila rosea]|uniref:Nucleotide-binding universal stress UspA family protein n=1 Tax=Acidipila rosea TaxID=768535 RepID=A0A4V2PV29_9BACT|nr:universal stress protein [Acidipila rosea]TCK72781.1 nucleotide-binding universal stress UspA family protein [Acidipila rosea]